MSESTKRVSGRQTAGQAVIQFLKQKGALDEEHAVGYDQLKNIKLTTQVLAYTIANLMQEKVVIRTDDELGKTGTQGTWFLFLSVHHSDRGRNHLLLRVEVYLRI